MPDPRVLKLAHTIVHYSCSLQQGEKFLIQTYGPADELARALVQEAAAAGALPFMWRFDERMERELLLGGSREQCELLAAHDAAFMAQMDAFCGVRAPVNPTELSDLPPGKAGAFEQLQQSRALRCARAPHQVGSFALPHALHGTTGAHVAFGF